MREFAVYLKPKISILNEMQQLRLKYDPLAAKISPHLTIVFPFPFESTSRLLQHLDILLSNIERFSFTLGEPEAVGGFVWLPIRDGLKEAIVLHDQLYTGILKEFLSLEHTYQSHITIARYDEASSGDAIRNEAMSLSLAHCGIFDEAVLESFDTLRNGTIEKCWSL